VKLIAGFLRSWWHGLWHLHRLETARHGPFVVYLGCECGRSFYGAKPLWWPDHLKQLSASSQSQRETEP
jgi:hypothetical protein